MGTVSYCAPEQFRDASSVDIRADIYSLGCTLFHLLAGEPPYGERTTIAEVMHAHLNEPFPKLVEVRPDTPPGLEKVLARMTAKDPAGRFASPGETAKALRPFAEGADLRSLFSQRRKQAPTHAVGSRGHRAEDLSSSLENDPGRRLASGADQIPRAVHEAADRPKRRLVFIAGAALAVLLMIVGAMFLLPRKPVVVLMDTPVEAGVYDPQSVPPGGTNADVLYVILRDLPLYPVKERIPSRWEGEYHILDLRPDLIVIHRSAFFHAINAELGLGKPPFADPKDEAKFWHLYRAGDNQLIAFIGFVGTYHPHTKFLVYSRGTDPQWLDLEFRTSWATAIGGRFPALKGRIQTMPIAGGVAAGTFGNPEVRKEIRNHVIEMLGLPEDTR